MSGREGCHNRENLYAPYLFLLQLFCLNGVRPRPFPSTSIIKLAFFRSLPCVRCIIDFQFYWIIILRYGHFLIVCFLQIMFSIAIFTFFLFSLFVSFSGSLSWEGVSPVTFSSYNGSLLSSSS